MRDWDADGAEEIFVLDYSNISAWRDTGEAELEQVWAAPAGVGWGFADLDGDGATELWIAYHEGQVVAYDPLNFIPVELGRMGDDLTAVRLADFFGDGRLQFITATENALIRSYAWPGLAPTWYSQKLPNCYSVSGVEDMVMLQADADPRLEVALACGHVLDPEVDGSEWQSDTGLWNIAAGNLDEDPYEELLAWDPNHQLTAFDIDAHTIAWQMVSPWRVGSIVIADALGDSLPEIIVGETWGRRVSIYDARTRQVIWQRAGSVSDISAAGVGDTDGDGLRNIVWGTADSWAERLFVAPLTLTSVNDEPALPRARAFQEDPSLATLQLDNDPALEIVQFEAIWYPLFEMTYRIFDGATGRAEPGLSLDLANLNGKGRHLRLAQHDIDSDGKDELLLVAEETMWLLDHDGGLITQAGTPYEFYPRWIGDADRDDALEVVGEANNQIIMLRLPDLQVKWSSVRWEEPIHGLDVADVDGDGRLEALFYAENRNVRCYELATERLEWQLLPYQQTRAIKFGDVDGKGRMEIIVVTSQGDLEFYDPKTRELIRTGPKVAMGYSEPRIALERLTGAAAPQLIIVDHDVSFFRSAADLRPAQSINVATEGAAFRVADTDGDGRKDVLIGENRRTMRLRALEASITNSSGR